MENNKRSRKKQIQPVKKKTRGSDFIVQGSILAAAGILVRIIGMLYRIPLANIIGDDGNGYYSAAFSIYSILLIVSSYSLPVAVSKMVSVRLAKREYRNSRRILKAALIYATVAGGIGASLLWFGADFFANDILNMPFCSFALKTLAPTIWVMAYLGVLRGYFQGHATMMPTAFSQVLEQIVNAVVSIAAAGSLFAYGIKSNLVHGETQYSYAFGAAGGTIGTGAGALMAFVFLVLIMLAYRPVVRKQIKRDSGKKLEGYGRISYLLCITILPIVVSSAIYNVSSVVDNAVFADAMDKLGRQADIASQWGIYMGKYHLLFNIPVAIANSLSSSLIPSLSQAVAARNKGQVFERVTMAIRFSMLIAIPATVGLTVLAGPVNNLLFTRTDNTMLIKMTMAGSLAVLFFSLSTVTNAVLQGINHMHVPIRNAAISLVLHVAALYLMLYRFDMGIYSVVYSNILFALFMCILNGLSIGYYLNYRQEIVKTFILPTIASGIMGAVAFFVYRGTNMIIKSNIIGTLSAIMAAVPVYGILLIKLRCVDEVELHTMPGGAKILRAAKKLHLL